MTVAMNQDRYLTDEARWAAVQRRDPAADGAFLYSVRTTGVYCRPSCAARPARRENMAFHLTNGDAEHAGFRPCKRCRPDLAPRAEREAALVAAACRAIEAAEEPPKLAELAAEAGFGAHHFQRLFKRIVGVSPKAYADAQRHRRVQDGLASGEAVTASYYDAGYNSSGRFYEAAPAMLGMTPTAYRAGGEGVAIRHAVRPCSLGRVLVAGTEKGVCAIFLGDDPAILEADLRERFPKARLVSGDATFEGWVEQAVRLVDDPASGIELPLDIQGTAFQRKVWEALRQIPAGHTASYGEIATSIGSPGAMRAVGAACGANKIAVAIPCHRAIARDGKLTGYHWGVERKRALLAKEQG